MPAVHVEGDMILIASNHAREIFKMNVSPRDLRSLLRMMSCRWPGIDWLNNPPLSEGDMFVIHDDTIIVEVEVDSHRPWSDVSRVQPAIRVNFKNEHDPRVTVVHRNSTIKLFFIDEYDNRLREGEYFWNGRDLRWFPA